MDSAPLFRRIAVFPFSSDQFSLFVIKPPSKRRVFVIYSGKDQARQKQNRLS